VCQEFRAGNSTVFFGGMGLMVITTLGYSAVVVRRYGSDHDDV